MQSCNVLFKLLELVSKSQSTNNVVISDRILWTKFYTTKRTSCDLYVIQYVGSFFLFLLLLSSVLLINDSLFHKQDISSYTSASFAAINSGLIISYIISQAVSLRNAAMNNLRISWAYVPLSRVSRDFSSWKWNAVRN